MLRLVAAAGLGYLVGGVLFGPLVARARGVDLYATGSGNPGATNVERALGRGPAAWVLGLDAAKGAVGAGLGAAIAGPDGAALGLVAAVLGHIVPFYAPRRGGKGVATLLGGLLAADPIAGAAFALAYVIGRKGSGYGSVGSLLGAAVGATVFAIRAPTPLGAAAGALAWLLVFVRHRDNLRRLSSGTEPKAGDHA